MMTKRKKLSDLSTNEIRGIESFLELNISTIFHEPDFNRIVAEVFDTEFSYYLVYNHNGELVALCPLHSKKEGLLKITYSSPSIYEVPYGGWIYNRSNINLPNLINNMRLSINETLVYTSIPLFHTDEYNQVKEKIKFQTAILNLEVSEDEIWRNSIHQKRRNMIRKAQKNNLIVEKYDSSGIEYYSELMRETYQSAGLKIKPKDYYEKVLKTYFSRNKAVILLVRNQTNLLSGNILLRNRHICHYWLSARKRSVGNQGQGELLQWEGIRWSKQNGSKYYDLCVVEQERLPDIARFKLGFSKNLIPFYYIKKRKLSYRSISKIQRCFLKA